MTSHAQQAVAGAGGVVMRGPAQAPEVLVLRYQSGAWVFPKGHLDAGESAEQTALREVQEEAGLRAEIIAALPSTHYANDKGVPREISWFLMTASGETTLEDTFSEGEFVPLSEALARLSYPEDRELLSEAAKRWEQP